GASRAAHHDQPNRSGYLPQVRRAEAPGGGMGHRAAIDRANPTSETSSMPLLNFWKSAKEDVLKMTIEQVVTSAGDGILHDHSLCSDEFRQFLNVAPIERLFDYARH